MYRPTVTALILVFVCLANSWLFITKVLPTLASDTPPGYQSIYASTADTSTIAWMISLNDSPVGSALSIVEPGSLQQPYGQTFTLSKFP